MGMEIKLNCDVCGKDLDYASGEHRLVTYWDDAAEEQVDLIACPGEHANKLIYDNAMEGENFFFNEGTPFDSFMAYAEERIKESCGCNCTCDQINIVDA